MYSKPAVAVFCKSLDEVVAQEAKNVRTGKCRWLTGPFIYLRLRRRSLVGRPTSLP